MREACFHCKVMIDALERSLRLLATVSSPLCTSSGSLTSPVWLLFEEGLQTQDRLLVPVCDVAVSGTSRTLPDAHPTLLIVLVDHSIIGIQGCVPLVILWCNDAGIAQACHSE